MKGYACRSKNSTNVLISTSIKKPEQKLSGWYWHIPGWFYSMSVLTFKRNFGFSLKPGTCKRINISISED